jgi:hypothetical protein
LWTVGLAFTPCIANTPLIVVFSEERVRSHPCDDGAFVCMAGSPVILKVAWNSARTSSWEGFFTITEKIGFVDIELEIAEEILVEVSALLSHCTDISALSRESICG